MAICTRFLDRTEGDKIKLVLSLGFEWEISWPIVDGALSLCWILETSTHGVDEKS